MNLRVAFFRQCTKTHFHEVFLSRPVPSEGGGRREAIPWLRADEFILGNFLAKGRPSPRSNRSRVNTRSVRAWRFILTVPPRALAPENRQASKRPAHRSPSP